MRNIKSFLITLSCFAILASCTSTSRICMTPAATDSLICPTLAKVSLTPESANLMFKLANIEMLRANAYAVRDVLEFFDKIETMLDIDTYAAVANEIIFNIAGINKKYQLELVLITQSFEVFQNLKIPIIEFDKGMLRTHIAQQRQLLEFMPIEVE